MVTHQRTPARRQEYAAPQLDSLDYWLQTQLTRISGKSALADAIRYGLARLQRLRPYLDDGRLSIDEAIEMKLQEVLTPTVKNWAGTATGQIHPAADCPF